MVLNGIQPPENMQNLASSRGITKCIPIPVGARAVLSSHCIIGPYDSTHTQLLNSATSMSGLHNDSPQRSAGSFNMVHPVRKALLPRKLMGNHTSTSLVDYDENDMIFLCSSSLPMEVGTPSSSTSSSCLLPSFIHGNSWEDQPLHSNNHSTITSYTDHLQSSVLMKPSKVVVTNSSASRCNISRIGSAESMSTASSARLLGKGQSRLISLGPEKIPSRRSTELSPLVFLKDETTCFDNEKMISAEDEYGSLACCLQGDFWAHPDGTLCDCEPLFKQEEHGMQLDDMIFDIPLPGSFSSATTSKTARQELVVGQVAEYRSNCMMSSFCSSIDLLGDEQEYGGFGSTSNLTLIRPDESHFAPGASSNIQADQLLDEVGIRGVMQERNSGKSAQPSSTGGNSDNNGNDIGGRPHLVRSCSLTILPPTSSDKGVEESSSLLRSSSLTNDIGLVQSRKRSFSASELSSEVDHSDSCRDLYESRSQLQAQMQLHAARVKQRAMVLQKQSNMQPGKKDDTQDAINDGLMPAGRKERSNPIQTRDEAVSKKLGGHNLYAINDQLLLHNQLINKLDQGTTNSNINVWGINDDLKYKQLGMKSNLQQMKQVKRRHGTATDPQSVAARTRREKFSERIRMLQSLVPNGERLDTVSMLGQTLEYIRFLQHQVWELYHGADSTTASDPPLPTNYACDKWKDFMQNNQHSANMTSATTSPA